MKTPVLLQGLRFVDSFFPSGGYAFSGGLESAVQKGAVRSSKDLSRYVEDLLVGSVGRREAIVVARAHRAVVTDDGDLLVRTDSELDAMQLGAESRAASRQMGRQVLRIAAEQFPEAAVLQHFHKRLMAGATPGHFPSAIGVTLASCGWTSRECVGAYLYQTTVGYTSAAMKLLPIGQREGQLLLQAWSEVLSRLAGEASPELPLAGWSPVQDIFAMRHSRLETRLFRS